MNFYKPKSSKTSNMFDRMHIQKHPLEYKKGQMYFQECIRSFDILEGI